MPVTVKKIKLWRKEVKNEPGVLAAALEPLATAGADLQVLMGYRYPGDEAKAAIELYPIAGKKLSMAAETAGLTASSIPTLLVEGDNRPGLAHAVAQAIADAGVNMGFLVAHVVGKKYSAVVGFETETDAQKAATLIRKVTTRKKGVGARR